MDSKICLMRKFVAISITLFCVLNIYSQNLDSTYNKLLDIYIYSSVHNTNLDTFKLKDALSYEFEITHLDTFDYERADNLEVISISGPIGESIEIGFTKNGNLKYTIRRMSQGEIVMESTYYFESGKIQSYTIGDQNRHELTISYYPDGIVQCIYRTAGGYMIGNMYCYYETGQLMTITTYNRDSSFHLKTFDPCGKLIREADYNSRSDLNGEMKYYNKRGRLSKVDIYKEGVKIGTKK